MDHRPDSNRHPCFDKEAKGECGRVHLPVAPKCNIKCNYCNRKHDCVNESRPGVSSAILSPRQAERYMECVVEKEPRITVAGIAGPGDPMANPKETLETMQRIKKRFPGMLLCLASNGLGLPPHADALADIGVSHVTVTVNAVDPEVGQRIYSWARDGKVIYRGRQAAQLLLERQLQAVEALKGRGVIVKINTIVIPGVNDHHVEEVARRIKELGADVLNVMPMYPNEGTVFGDVEEPSKELIEELRHRAGRHMPQMTHCTRCRADAVGLLDQDRCGDFQENLSSCSRMLVLPADRPYVAVATREGMLVNEHLGEARRFQIWENAGEDGFHLVEERRAPEPGGGPRRWETLAGILSDCKAVLVSGIGENPRRILVDNGVVPFEMNSFIEMGLKAVYEGKNPGVLKGRRLDGQCKGEGGGCLA